MKRTPTNTRSRALRRVGYTLIELIVSMATASIIMGGLSSSLYIAGRALNQDGTARRADADQVLDEFVADVEHALSFSERTANAVTFTVPDRDGDNKPDTIRYAWSGTVGDPLTYEYNGSTAETIAADVYDFNLAAMTRLMEAAVIPPAEGGNKLLLVVTDTANPTTQETARQTLIESWGYTVTLIDDGDTQANFDAAVAANDVAYICVEVNDTSLDLKLRDAAIGVVNEKNKLCQEMGMAGESTEISVTAIEVTDASHYITSPFGIGSLMIFSLAQESTQLLSPLASGIESLAEDGSNPVLSVLPVGAAMEGGGNAAGRRVQLPWGVVSLDFNALTDNGRLLMHRAIEWGAGADSSGGGPLLFVVSDDANPSTQEIARQTLMESWGYTVTLLDDDATTLELANALVGKDVVYISQEITTLTTVGKLADAAIGVVNEEGQLIDDLGLASGSPTAVTLTNASITDNTHYITSPFDLGDLTLSDPWQPFTYVNAGVAAGVESLATVFNKSSLLVAETGAELLDSSPAPGRRVQLPWGSDGFEFTALNSHGETLMRRAIEWAAGAGEPQGIPLLFVVADPASLTTSEADSQTLMESWGYTVTLIDDDDTQANYDAATAQADVAYVSGAISAIALNTKLRESTIGIADEEIQLADEFGFASVVSTPLSNTGDLDIENGTHYITSPFGAVTIHIMAPGEVVHVLGDPADRRAPDIQDLGRMGSRVNLACLDTGALLKDGGTAAGRRVLLPWGHDGFDFSGLTQDGQTIMQRSIEWAAGTGGGGGGGDPPADGNFGYETQFASTFGSGNGVQVGTQVTMPENGTLTSITAYIYPGGGGKNYRFAIYSDNAGEPGNLLVESAVDNQSGTGWKTISVTPTPLTAGTYWLALAFSSNQQDYYYESTGGNTRHKLHNAVSNGFISVWPGATTPYTHKISIYGTYTPTP